MSALITKQFVRQILPKRNPQSHKGQNGRILIIGGSIDYYGAPILAALGACGSGVDLVHLLVPECNFDVSRSFYPDFIVHEYPGKYFNSRAVDTALGIAAEVDALLIGPGLGKYEEISRDLIPILEKSKRPIVLDADAIDSLLLTKKDPALNLTITPHRNEFQKVTGTAVSYDDKNAHLILENYANDSGVTILLKGPIDFIAAQNRASMHNASGNAGMTVGGSGDVLAGLVTGFISQRVPSFEACCAATYCSGAAGDTLAQQKGYGFLATDLALELPYTIHSI